MMPFSNIKFVCLDNDDTLFRSSPLIQFHVEKNWPRFATTILKAKERAISMVQYQYDSIVEEVRRARLAGDIPNLPNFNITRNDVIKTNDSSQEGYPDFEYEVYSRPLIEAAEALHQVQYEKEMFLEARDCTLEADGRLSDEEGKIPYKEFYMERNWFPYVKENVNDLYKQFGERLVSLTAHNGPENEKGREFEWKGEAIHRINPNIKHYGLPFHKEKHIDGIRRPRNSKIERLQDIYDLDDMQGVVFLEDSKEVLRMVKEAGGIPIYVNTGGFPNPEGYPMVRSVRLESVLRELRNLGWENGVGVNMPNKVKKL